MSGFASLFGNVESQNDSSVEKLFQNAADGPISKDQISYKPRTIVNIPNQGKRRFQQVSENQDETKEEGHLEEGEDIKEDDIEEEDKSLDHHKSKKSRKNHENDDLEAKYFEKVMKDDEDEEATPSKEEKEEEEEEAKEISKTVTEVNEKPVSSSTAASEAEKATRTIFVGNVPSQVLKSKPLFKAFKKIFKEYGKIESVRFRSISFADNLPKKVSFVKKNLHESRDSVNAYIVYAEEEHSLEASKQANGTVFESHHLRVDHVTQSAPRDNKRTIFVGNLDFEEQEENLWRYFNEKLDNDVKSVRIVRDPKTNLGRGFALVQFKDSLSVNKALMLNDKPMDIMVPGDKKKTPRKLRITRTKNDKSNVSKIGEKLGNKKNNGARVKGHGSNMPIEGERARKGAKIKGIKGLKTGKVKKPRIRERSTKFKNERNSMQKEVEAGKK
ncbi:NOP12 [Candida oxycetoniae]|uniref:Nucleolar protein 12 n=1 Tax=Candida oxycetoniae TaxID=497107 RepID=A0AAI9SW42_9ASCO|nr:NOP12 [Candida oxycetoniae]KAI3403615.2 NOP12 [Candida oxycetoniae]